MAWGGWVVRCEVCERGAEWILRGTDTVLCEEHMDALVGLVVLGVVACGVLAGLVVVAVIL